MKKGAKIAFKRGPESLMTWLLELVPYLPWYAGRPRNLNSVDRVIDDNVRQMSIMDVGDMEIIRYLKRMVNISTYISDI